MTMLSRLGSADLLRTSGKILSLQYIRAIGAIAVVVWHTGWSRSVLGQSGVDLFFIVSGFVMMLVSGRESSPRAFTVSRLVRIVPLYWVMTIITGWLDHSSLPMLLPSMLFLPDRPFPIVIQGWSLDLEMLYYGLFAMTLLAPSRWRAVLLAAEIVLLVTLPPDITARFPVIAAWSNPLACEFLAGALLFLAWRGNLLPTGWAAWALLFAAVALLLSTQALGDAPAGWVRVIYWGGPALGIAAAGLGIERSGQLPFVPLLERLGGASYAIYLTHVLVIGLLTPVLHPLWAPLAVSLAIVASCLGGWIAHQVLERPLLRLGKRAVAGRVPARPIAA